MTNQQRDSMMSIVLTLLPTIGSLVATIVTVTFLLGGANENMLAISKSQEQQGQQIVEMAKQMGTIDKTQAVMANQMANLTEEMSRLNQGWTSLNEDMKCIRLMAASKGDITKC